MSRRLADSIVPKLTPGDRDRIARLLTILISASALRVWRDHRGSTVEEAASDIDWVISAAITSDLGDIRHAHLAEPSDRGGGHGSLLVLAAMI